MSDAKSGKLEDKVSHSGLWIVDGQRVRYELECTSRDLAEELKRAGRTAVRSPGGNHTVYVSGLQEGYLKNERLGAQHSKLIKTINIVPVDVGDKAGVEITPFGLGVMGSDERSSPAAILSGIVDGRYVGKSDGIFEEDGRAVVGVSCGKLGEGLRLWYRFDPGRGYLPVHFWDSDSKTGKTYYEVFILEAKNCGSGRWFPMHSIVVYGDRDAPWPKTVQQTLVTELKLEQPEPTQFFLEVAGGTRLTVVGTRDYMDIGASTRVYESQLESLVQKASEVHALVQERQKAAEAREASPVPRRGWPVLWIAAINCLLFVVLIGALMVRRTRRRRELAQR